MQHITCYKRYQKVQDRAIGIIRINNDSEKNNKIVEEKTKAIKDYCKKNNLHLDYIDVRKASVYGITERVLSDLCSNGEANNVIIANDLYDITCKNWIYYGLRRKCKDIRILNLLDVKEEAYKFRYYRDIGVQNGI